MKRILFTPLLLAAGAEISIQAQELLRTFPIVADPPSGFHLDRMDLEVGADFVGAPIKTMDLHVYQTQSLQVNLDGLPTAFRTPSLSFLQIARDSHFLIDPSQFEIVSQEENSDGIHASIRFDKPVVFGTEGHLPIVQIIAGDGHIDPRFGPIPGSIGGMEYSVTMVDGRSFSGGFMFIPEPSSVALLTVGIVGFTWWGWRRRFWETRQH